MFFRNKQHRWFYLCLGILSLGLAIFLVPAQASQPKPVSHSSIVAQSFSTAQAQVGDDLEQGRIFYQTGRFEEAITRWRAAVQRYQNQGDRSNEALAWSYLSMAYQELKQWDTAEQAIGQSLDLLQTAKPPAEDILWAQVLNTQASLEIQTSKVEAALATWQRAQTFYEEAGDQVGGLGSQINQAKALQALGFYRRSRQQLEALQQKLSELPDSEIKVSGLYSLGMAIYVMGDATSSRQVLEESLTIASKLKAKSYYSSILLNLGKTAADLGDPNSAWDDFVNAKATATSSIEQVQAQLEGFKLLINYDRRDEAKSAAPQLLQQLRELPPSRTTLYTAINFVATLNRLNDPAQILPLKDLAHLMAATVQSAKAIQDSQAEAYALYQWGQLYQRTKQWTEARKLMQQSLDIARQLHAEDIVAQTSWRLGQAYREEGNRAAAIAAYTGAVTSLKSLRTDLVATNPDVQFSFRESVEPVYRELVDILLTSKSDVETLEKARALIESLKIAELDNFFREACLDNTKQVDHVDPNATVIYPIILPDRLAVILSNTNQPLRYYSTPVSKVEVDQTLDQLLSGLHPVSDSKQRDCASQKLYDWLIRPAETDQALKDAKTLVFVLDSRLQSIPMSALYDGERYLIEKYAIAISPGLQLLAAQQFQQNQIDAVIGGISEPRSGFSALPEVESEMRQISKTIPSSLLINQAFTNLALSDRVKATSINVVHLATHGQFSSRQEDTFLLTWDGRISIRELAELLKNRSRDASKGVDLLVLSACDTATGDDRAVLGLAGLAVKSGARSTVATLWPVKDKVAATLMTQFYNQLQQSGTTKAEALRQAQIKLLRQTDFKDPFFWSAFVLVGNWL